MSHRVFTDANGTSWEVWDVRPTGAAEIVQVRNQFADGWLAFQSERGRRRLAPIPEGWESWPDSRLCALCGEAVEQPSRKRLIE